MAINLLNNSIGSLRTGNQPSAQGTEQAQNAGSVKQAAAAVLREIRSLSAGDTLKGQLVSKDGNSIELLLGNNARLNTMLEQDMNLTLGQLMSFEVKSNQNGQLTLRPLFANMSNSSTIMSALDAAGIAASDAAVEMVDTLMQNGMPINKDMLGTISREMVLYPDVDPADIVMLHKMDIPVNEGNVHQMHLYNNNNQWMMESVGDSADELTKLLTDTLMQGTEEAQNILDGLKELLPPAEPENAEGVMLTEGEAQVNADIVNGEAAGEATPDNMTEVSENAVTQGKMPSSAVAPDISDAVAGAKEGVIEAADEESSALTGAARTLDAEATIKGGTDNATVRLSDGINKYNVFDRLNDLSAEELARPEVRTQIKNAVTELLKDNMLMKPEDIKEEKFVQKYYERTMNLADNIEKLMQQNGKADTDFTRTVSNMKENTTFMNHINDMYNYVQLPLKMNEAQANGDLYVYARKKGRSGGAEDGKLTALLHLSMDHLGDMDIFLTLSEGQKLNTKFTLEKEEMIDFIAAHIDELNARLEKKGYNVGTVVTHKDGPDRNVIENIVGDESNILLSTQSFDARA